MKKHIQGDVMLRAVKKPAEFKTAPEGAEILALGEHSGHGHVLEGCDIMIGADEKKYVIPKGGVQARLLHKHLTSNKPADHDPIVLDPIELGEDECYEVVIQQRYDPFEKTLKQVID